MSDGPARLFLRTLGQGLSLACWRRPRSRVQLAGFGVFLASCVLALSVFAVQDYLLADKPATFYRDGLYVHASYFLALLIASWLAVRTLGRTALWLVLSSLALVLGIVWTALSIQITQWFVESGDLRLWSWHVLLAAGGFAALLRAMKFIDDTGPAWRHLMATLVFVLVMAWPWYGQQSAWFWYPSEQEASNQPAATVVSAPAFDPETVLADQPRLLQRRLESIRMQTPGKVDLFAVGFAGDGSEPGFRNEVEYFSRLMAQRFDARARTLPLINSPGTLADTPLATLPNLRAGLAGIASRMDTDEDVLVLFLTSHGSQDHVLLVDLDPLPLAQIEPEDLRSALDDAGIRWRVVVVSACYSGGFVDALRDARTLVITAARRDRSSFGCGVDSQITWFGKAFLAQALNQTTDFRQAFALASRQVRAWELADGEIPSVPQMDTGALIGKKLDAWRASLKTAGPVPFASAQGRVSEQADTSQASIGNP